jgi:hypothetical protein
VTKPTPLTEFYCPGCQRAVQEAWVACPVCGQRLKPPSDFWQRAAVWSFVLGGFVLGVLLIARQDRDAGVGFGILFGFPLAYVFGKAVYFRMSGRPLTWRELGWTSMRTGLVSIGTMVVLPILIGVAALLLLFAVCGLAIVQGKF